MISTSQNAPPPQEAPVRTDSSLESVNMGWDATKYRQVSERFQAYNGWKVLKHLHRFCGYENVLDLGCGDGSITYKFLARRVPFGKVVGIDKDLNMIGRAKHTYGGSSSRNPLFIEANICKLEQELASHPNIPKKFDLIFSNATLHWLIDDETQTQSDQQHLAALRGISGRLSPEGKVLLAFLGRDALADLFEASLEVAGSGDWADSLRGFKFPSFYTVEHYCALMEQSGLHVEDAQIVDRVMKFESKDKLIDWYSVCMRSIMGRLEGLDETVQREFATQAVTRYLEERSDEEVSLVYKDLVVRAKQGTPRR